MATDHDGALQDPDCNSDFQEALNSFTERLSVEEKQLFIEYRNAEFKDSSELLADFDKFGKALKNTKLTTALRAVKRFSDQLSPYFTALDIIVQSHPEWTAIAWGAFRFILQV